MARSYDQLGMLAQDRGDYDEAARQYQRSLDINERLGDQAGMAASYHHLGILAQARGDYEEAARQYQRALDINERLGNQPAWPAATTSSASSPRTAGTTTRPPASTSAPSTSTSGSATRPAWPAATASSAILDADRDAPAAAVIAWHVKALAIRLQLGVPQAVIDLRRLAAHRRELGAEPFTGLLAQATDDTDLADTITSLLDQVDAAGDGTA